MGPKSSDLDLHWTITDLPGAESRTFHFQCYEEHDAITVYFGVHEGKAYLAEHVALASSETEVPENDTTAGSVLLLAIADMDGNTQFELMGGTCGNPDATLDGLANSGARGCYGRAHELIFEPGFPTLRNFTEQAEN
jgi:hypothetical protein